jgi:hypothetical protein
MTSAYKIQTPGNYPEENIQHATEELKVKWEQRGLSHGLGNRKMVTGFRVGRKVFLFSRAFRPALERTQPPIQWVLRNLSPGLEARHSTSSNAGVKNERSPTFSLPVVMPL